MGDFPAWMCAGFLSMASWGLWGGIFPSVTGARLGRLDVEDHSFSLIFYSSIPGPSRLARLSLVYMLNVETVQAYCETSPACS